MAVASDQTSFSAGEISPELFGQVDLKKAVAACSTARNLFVQYKGGLASRGGLAAIGRCKQTGNFPPRPIPFQFSITQGYVLEFGDQYLRFVFQGGYVLENPVAILGASRANPIVISVAGTPFANGDWVFAQGVGGMTQLNGNTYIIANVGVGSFQLTDLNGNAIDSSAYGAWTSGGTFSRVYTVSTPYAAIDLPYLKYAQSADVMSLTCANPTTGTEYPPYDLTRRSAIDWQLVQTQFNAVIAAPASISVSGTSWHVDGSNNDYLSATFGYQVTAVDKDGNESIGSVYGYVLGTDPEIQGATNTVTFGRVSGAKYYNIYRSPATVNTRSDDTLKPPPAGSIYGFVGSSYATQLRDSASTRDISKVPPIHANPFARGQILAVNITNGGSGLSTVTYSITTTAGSGFSGAPAVIAGSLGAFTITSGGSGYAAGDSIAFNGAGFASGAIIFGMTNPVDGDTITLNSVVWTFVDAITGSNQTLIGGSPVTTINQLVSDLSASPNALLRVAAYSTDTTIQDLLITYNTAGVAGNAYTLAASVATPSGSTLTGGTGSGSLGTHATGNIVFTVNMTAPQNIVLNGVTWTFVAAGAAGNQTNIGANLAATLTQLASDLNASATAGIAVATYTVNATTLSVSYDALSATGNTYTLSAGTTTGTPSGPNLTGGTNPSSTPTGTLVVGPDSGTYPGVVAYFQQRRFYANSFNDPDTFWASQTTRYANFDTRIPTIATDAVTASPWTEQVNGIQWLVPMPGGLIAMTGSRAWQIIGEGSYQLNVQPITPSTTQAQPQAFNGCSATIPPIVIDYDVIYVESIGNTTVRDLSWNFLASIYTGADLTILSSHLFLYREIQQWAWARNPYKVLWASCNDGTMLAITYLKEQEVYGWTRHDTQGLVKGVASVTEPPVNALYCITQRFTPTNPTGVYFMERMDNRIWQSVEDAYAVDSGVSNPMSAPNVTIIASAASGAGVTFSTTGAAFSPSSVGRIIRMGNGIATVTAYTNATTVTGTWNLNGQPSPTGLPSSPAGAWTIATPVTTLPAPHLAGMTLVGLADGVPLSGLVAAADGTVTLPFSASNAKVGLGFLAQLQTAYLNGPQVTQGGRKVIPAATVRVAASAKFQTGTNQPDGSTQNPPQLGPTWTNMTTFDPQNATGGQKPPVPYTSPDGQTVFPLWTGDLRGIGGGADWVSKGQVAVQQSLPMALEVTAIMPERLDGDLPEETYSPRNSKQQGARL